MAEFTQQDVVELTKCIIDNDIPKEYTTRDAQEALRQMLIQANGGSDKINPRTFRNTECFTLIEKIIDVVRNEGLVGDEFWNNLVEEVKVNNGDRNEFYTPDDSLFIVSEIGRGNQGIRRQRFQAGSAVTIPTHTHAVRIYEHFDRIMSGRIDFNTFVERVAKSFQAKKYEDIYAVFSGINASTSGMYAATYVTGSYDEDAILNVIDHIEADTNDKAIIIGARPALRKLKMDVMCDQAKNDMYGMGYYGKFNGTDTVLVRQRNKVGTHDFIFPQDRIYILAGSDRPIKYVEEGETFFNTIESRENADLTQEYVMMLRYGLGLILHNGIGCYIFDTSSASKP